MSNSEVKALVFNIQGYSIQDGPGIRTTVFLKGCPLSCLWCSNPESQTLCGDVLHSTTKCVKCYRCVNLCKNGAVSLPKNPGAENAFPVINHNICADCQDHTCVYGCYESALQDVGKPMTVDEVMETLLADAPFFQSSGGGATVSGGEPVLHHEFCRELFKQCRDNYIHTAIETCGYVPWEKFKSVLEFTDLVLYDIKHMDSETHKKLTGVPNELIHNNLRKILTETPVSVTMRVPVIPGANDSNENLEATAEFAKQLGLRHVDIMPYHRMGMGKYARLGREYPLGEDVLELSKDRVKEIQELFQARGLVCNVGG